MRELASPADSDAVAPLDAADVTSLLDGPVLVIRQRITIRGFKVSYDIEDVGGRGLGRVQEVNRGVVRSATQRNSDGNRKYQLHLTDSTGRIILVMTRPANWMTSSMIVTTPSGILVGRISQVRLGATKKAISAIRAGRGSEGASALSSAARELARVGRARFRLESGGREIGAIHADNLRASDFGVVDATGTEIARVTKMWAGRLKEYHTSADDYAVEMHDRLSEPLRSLVFAAALAIDLAREQTAPNHDRRR